MDNKDELMKEKLDELRKSKISEAKQALEYTEGVIEKAKELRKRRLKGHKILMVFSFLILVFVMARTTIKDSINAIDIFSICLIVVSTHSAIKDNIDFKIDIEQDLKELNREKDFFEKILTKLEEEELNAEENK